MNKPIIIEVFNDDGSHSHWTLVTEAGVKVWSENPDECKANGYPVELPQQPKDIESIRSEFLNIIGKNITISNDGVAISLIGKDKSALACCDFFLSHLQSKAQPKESEKELIEQIIAGNNTIALLKEKPKEIAVKFAEWITVNQWNRISKHDGLVYWSKIDNYHYSYTTENLYQEYLKTKQ